MAWVFSFLWSLTGAVGDVLGKALSALPMGEGY
jgi:hypothetical protein